MKDKDTVLWSHERGARPRHDEEAISQSLERHNTRVK